MIARQALVAAIASTVVADVLAAPAAPADERKRASVDNSIDLEPDRYRRGRSSPVGFFPGSFEYPRYVEICSTLSAVGVRVGTTLPPTTWSLIGT